MPVATQPANEYNHDAIIFLSEAAARTSERMQDADIIQATLNLALGIERILKGILYDLNPTYVLMKPDFKHSVQVLYKDKISNDLEVRKELAANPDSDVLTFRNSLLRAQVISETVRKNK